MENMQLEISLENDCYYISSDDLNIFAGGKTLESALLELHDAAIITGDYYRSMSEKDVPSVEKSFWKNWQHIK